MSKRVIQLIGVVIVAAIAVFLVSVFMDKDAEAPAEQNADTSRQAPEQTNEIEEGDTEVQPNVNTQEFILTASNVSCSTSTINGITSRSCSGNIRVVPRAQSDMDPGLYKINEQTKLLKGGQEQDLNSLQQLAQSNTVVRLKLAAGSEDTLVEIRY